MKGSIGVAVAAAAVAVNAAPPHKRDVDTVYPYTGPTVPIADWVDQTVNGNGKGFPRLVEAPAVKPGYKNPTNNVNVVSLSYFPKGINVHFQTPFGLGKAPTVKYGQYPWDLFETATGKSVTYDRTPPCSSYAAVTQCSQFYHDVQITNLQPGTKYYYVIEGSNGTTTSQLFEFETAPAAGTKQTFSVAMINDMGYTNAAGTYKQLNQAVKDGVAFAYHGGDLSYADDWYSGVLPCASDWPVCYNGTSSALPGGVITAEYDTPLPAGEIPDQGGPQGGDASTIYESNWDLWQQWMNNITTKIPYMTSPGNHEASCIEFDGPGNVMTAYLNQNKTNSTAAASALTYYSCPESQRNFTAYQHRFKMPGDTQKLGVGNFWYSFDYGLAHFISLDGETDFPYSPEYPFVRDLTGNETHPKESETFSTDSGPFGYINGTWKSNKSYQQLAWLAQDLASIDRTKTPWVFAMSHRPAYSSQVSSYQANIRAAFEGQLIAAGVDAYIAGHIHWYERMFPMLANNTGIDKSSIVNNHTYYTNPGKSMTHIVNGQAGNIESHSELSGSTLNITAYLDTKNYGYTKLTVHNATSAKFEFIHGADGSVGDSLDLLKRP